MHWYTIQSMYKVLIYLLLPLYSPLWGLHTIWATVVECVIVVLTCQVFKLQINPLCLSPWHRTETQGCITTGFYKATYNFFWLYLWNIQFWTRQNRFTKKRKVFSPINKHLKFLLPSKNNLSLSFSLTLSCLKMSH